MRHWPYLKNFYQMIPIILEVNFLHIFAAIYTGQYQIAIKSAKYSLKKPSLRAPTYYNLACIYNRLNDQKQAIEHFKLAQTSETYLSMNVVKDPDLVSLVQSNNLYFPKIENKKIVLDRGELDSSWVQSASKTKKFLVAFGPGRGHDDGINWGIRYFWGAQASLRGWTVICLKTPQESWFSQKGIDLFKQFHHWITHQFPSHEIHMAGVSNGGISALFLATQTGLFHKSLTLAPGGMKSDQMLTKLNHLRTDHINMFVGQDDQEWWLDQAKQLNAELQKSHTVNFQTFQNNGHVLTSLFGGEFIRLIDRN